MSGLLRALGIAVSIMGLGCTARPLTAPVSERANPGGPITYRVERVETIAGRPPSPEQTTVLEVLNRADAGQFSKLPVLVMPDVWLPDVLSYSPFPDHYAWGREHGKLLVVDQPFQAFAAYERGQLVRWGPVSSGRRQSQTPSGLLHLNWRSRGRHSTVDPDWYMPWYFNFLNERGLSLHEYTLPGRPASHACIRLLERDARWLFDWGEEWTLDRRGREVVADGTPVLILGCYDFDAEPPWRSLSRLARGLELPQHPMLTVHACDRTGK